MLLRAQTTPPDSTWSLNQRLDYLLGENESEELKPENWLVPNPYKAKNTTAEANLDSTDTYEVPLTAEDNILEITIANFSGKKLNELFVKINEVPDWIAIERYKSISALSDGKDLVVPFTFSIKGDTEIGKKATLDFEVVDHSGNQTWSKQLTLEVTAPNKFELDQNYPNPFNPATTIRYRLPAEMKVTVNVYNILGRRVATLVDNALQSAGQQALRFDGSRLASGMYFFRITAQANGGQNITRLQKMTLIK